ncbi:MAG: biotin/lipoyl-binding protein, partial [Verrucomicrobia bacterium]|nr:biotin/lipoyl-binding protein [Verrucomicrobiota bacterium]
METDGYRRSWWALVLVGVLLVAGGGWFFLARVAVYETTDQARLEAQRTAHPVAAPVAGRVVTNRLTLGQKVQPGDLLVELESESQRLQLEEEKSRLTTFRGRREALRRQVQAEEQAWPAEKEATQVAMEEARARQREAESAAKFAEGEAERLAKLDASGLI